MQVKSFEILRRDRKSGVEYKIKVTLQTEE